MSSSLSYLLSSFDEENQTTTTTTAGLNYPCFDNTMSTLGGGPWINSTSPSLAAFSPEAAAMGGGFNGSLTTAPAATALAPLRYPYSSNAARGLNSLSSGASRTTGSTTNGATTTTARRPLSPTTFTYRPRSQQERLRSLFPNQDGDTLQEMQRSVEAMVRAEERGPLLAGLSDFTRAATRGGMLSDFGLGGSLLGFDGGILGGGRGDLNAGGGNGLNVGANNGLNDANNGFEESSEASGSEENEGEENEEGEEDSIQTIDFSHEGEEEDSDDEEEETSGDEETPTPHSDALERSLFGGSLSNQGGSSGAAAASADRASMPAPSMSPDELNTLYQSRTPSPINCLGERAANLLASFANNDANFPSTAAARAATSEAPPTRAKRQAAISCLERISTAIATDGMGGQYSSDDDQLDDRKPSALRNSLRKRPLKSSTGVGKKRKCEEIEEEESPTCCICLEVPTKEDLASISGCSHPFCFGCIEKWADRENTCPLCKARFSKIEKVHGPKSSEKAKRVATRNQRSDMSSMGGMDGLFGGMDSATGTWPTHIAQLLFSGLGASTIHGGIGDRYRMGSSVRRTSDTARTLPGAGLGLASSVGVPAPPRVFASRRAPTFASALSGASAASASNTDREPFNVFLDRVNAHRQQQEQLQRLQDNVEARTSVFSQTSVLGASSSPFFPYAATTTHTTTLTTTTESSTPWGTTRASSVHAHIAPTLGTSSGMTLQSLTTPSVFSSFANPSSNSTAAAASRSEPAPSAAAARSTSTIGNPFASLNMTRGEEDEEQILSSVSPTSHLQRLQGLQREMEYNTNRYQYSATAPSSGITSAARGAIINSLTNSVRGASTSNQSQARAFDPQPLRRSAFDYSTEVPGAASRNIDNNMGRSAETALEIDDSDSDDEPEVVAVEAMM